MRSTLEQFNFEKFKAELERTRLERGLTWKEVSKLSGVNPCTLSRIRRGLRPDFENGVRLIVWANLDIYDFCLIGRRPVPPITQFLSTLSDDPQLTPTAATELTLVIAAAYSLAVGGAHE